LIGTSGGKKNHATRKGAAEKKGASLPSMGRGKKTREGKRKHAGKTTPNQGRKLIRDWYTSPIQGTCQAKNRGTCGVEKKLRKPGVGRQTKLSRQGKNEMAAAC